MAAATRRPVRGQGARLGARVLDAWERGAVGAGGESRSPDAEAVFVGSEHIRKVLEEVVGHVDRVHVVPPGVDVDEFVPLPRDEALRDLLAESRADPPNPGNANERLPDEGNADRLEAFFAEDEPTVLYFGKLLQNKGVHVLFEALRDVDARAVVVGFGDYREELERTAPPRTLFTGPLEHRHLAKLIPLTDVTVVPSIFPEAFGMVAAEAAAAGSLPLVANHSGLAEIAAGVAAEYPERAPRPDELRDGRPRGPRREAAPAPGARPRGAGAARTKRRDARSSSAGAGRASRGGCSSLFTNLSPWREERVLSGDEQLRLGREQYESATDFTVAVEEEFAILDPDTLALTTASRS